MTSTVIINSASQWRSLLTSSSVVIVDFHADWCGPCKMIAPHFEALSTKFSKPGKITFAKVDTDRQQEVAAMYRVRAMPTFLVLHNGSVVETVQGANPPALAAAVNKGVKLASSAPGANFSSGGRTLGGEPAAAAARGGRAATAGTSGQGLVRPLKWDLNSFINSLIIIVGLYMVSLLTIDAYKSAETSSFNIKNPIGPAPKAAAGAGGAAGRPAPKSGVRTLNDL